MSDIEDEPPPVLLPCTICSRTFRPEVLERHAKVCEKTATKKRRVFDSFKNRVSGTELEEFLGPAPLPGQVVKRPIKSPIKKKGPPKWKETHENLIAVLRAARGVTQSSDITIEPAKHGGNEQCPSCNRFFGPRAFDRHVEFCKEKTARIKMTPSKVSQAQERLEARTKYRAPLSIKPKLTTKEKYSPMPARKESTESCSLSPSSTKTSPPVPALNKNAKVVKQNSSNFTRQSPIRSSERQRSISPTKKFTASSKPQTKLGHQPKTKENLKDPDELRPRTGSKPLTQEKLRSSYVKLSQLEDEIPSELSKMKPKSWKNTQPKSRFSSDDETNVNIETEIISISKQSKISGKTKNKWSSSESISKPVSLLNEKIKHHEEKFSDDEKMVLKSKKKKEIKKEEEKITKTELKSPKKNKKYQKTQILNDLSVNDESFGIFVAPYKPSSPNFIRNFQNLAKDSILKAKGQSKKEKTKIVEDKVQVNTKTKIRKSSGKKEKSEFPDLVPPPSVENQQSFIAVESKNYQSKSQKIEKYSNSKIPKPKLENIVKYSAKVDNLDLSEIVTFDQTNNRNDDGEGEKNSEQSNQSAHDKNAVGPEFMNTYSEIKKNSKKWRNISEMSTDDLLHMSENFDVCKDYNFEDVNESKIWEIAAEQFLKGEEAVENASATSIDSLNECATKKQIIPIVPNKNLGDDFIVLHVTDPAKMDENDADMKVSVSEPCFPYSGKIQKSKEKTRHGKKTLDILLFTASPFAIQKPFPKKKKQIKVKKQKPVLRLSSIREKTFLANDIPKAKQRKIEIPDQVKLCPIQNVDFFFETVPKGSLKEKKKFFLDKLKRESSEKVKKWHIASDFHAVFMEDFCKSVEEDIKELKNLFKGKKKRRKFNIEEFKREKLKEIKREKLKKKVEKNSIEITPKKKYEYFEIDLSDDKKSYRKEKSMGINTRNKNSLEVGEKNEIFNNNKLQNNQKKKFESFEIINDDIMRQPNQRKKSGSLKINENILESLNEVDNAMESDSEILNKTYSIVKENTAPKMASTPKKNYEEGHEKPETRLSSVINEPDISNYLSKSAPNSSIKEIQNFTSNDSMQTSNYFNSSLENIEEVDEGEEKNFEEESLATPKKDIEIEDFILTKPNTAKLLSKEKSCLDQLFPKPQKISEALTTPDSITAIHLDFTADSLFDLKSNEEKNLNELSNVRNSRMLQKRNKKESHLPQIKIKNDENKEKSMISLIDLWKNKRRIPEKEKLFKVKVTPPKGKLTPLFDKNSFQM